MLLWWCFEIWTSEWRLFEGADYSKKPFWRGLGLWEFRVQSTYLRRGRLSVPGVSDARSAARKTSDVSPQFTPQSTRKIIATNIPYPHWEKQIFLAETSHRIFQCYNMSRQSARPKRAAEDYVRTHDTDPKHGGPSKKPRFDIRNPSALAPDALEEDATLDADVIGGRRMKAPKPPMSLG